MTFSSWNYFTFQYVSINTAYINSFAPGCDTLHSNMFLLIHLQTEEPFSHFLPLHSNMFLLIQSRLRQILRGLSGFTFQYVSINTRANSWDFAVFWPLHSNMFLLIHEPRTNYEKYLQTLHSNMFLLIPG